MVGMGWGGWRGAGCCTTAACSTCHLTRPHARTHKHKLSLHYTAPPPFPPAGPMAGAQAWQPPAWPQAPHLCMHQRALPQQAPHDEQLQRRRVKGRDRDRRQRVLALVGAAGCPISMHRAGQVRSYAPGLRMSRASCTTTVVDAHGHAHTCAHTHSPLSRALAMAFARAPARVEGNTGFRSGAHLPPGLGAVLLMALALRAPLAPPPFPLKTHRHVTPLRAARRAHAHTHQHAQARPSPQPSSPPRPTCSFSSSR